MTTARDRAAAAWTARRDVPAGHGDVTAAEGVRDAAPAPDALPEVVERLRRDSGAIASMVEFVARTKPDLLAGLLTRSPAPLDREPEEHSPSSRSGKQTTAKGKQRKPSRSNREFVIALADLLLEVVTDFPNLNLSFVTLTTPRGYGPIAAVGDALAREVAQQGEGHGVFLSLDKRDDGSEHFHGLLLARVRRLGLDRWCALTGSTVKRATTVTGWEALQDGEGTDGLRFNLRNVTDYMYKPLPGHELRDVPAQTMASGPFAGTVERVVDRGLTPEPSRPMSGLDEMSRAVTSPRVCRRCRKPLTGKQLTACSDKCRKWLSRDGAKEKSNVPTETSANVPTEETAKKALKKSLKKSTPPTLGPESGAASALAGDIENGLAATPGPSASPDHSGQTAGSHGNGSRSGKR